MALMGIMLLFEVYFAMNMIIDQGWKYGALVMNFVLMTLYGFAILAAAITLSTAKNVDLV